MSYKNDSDMVILNRYAKASSAAKAELYETYDRIRDLTVSGSAMGGSGVGKFGNVIMNFARMFGGSSFIPTFGSEAINIPGSSYYAPISGGTGITPGGQAAFGLAPFSNFTGVPSGGAAPLRGSFGASISPLAMFSSLGSGSALLPDGFDNSIGGWNYPFADGSIGGVPADGFDVNTFSSGFMAGGAAPIAASQGLAAGAGVAAGAGYGRNWVLPAAGIVSGIGGLLTTLGPYFGPFGLAASGAGTIMNGLAGSVLSSFQTVSNRLLVNADSILSEKVKNLETTVKMLDAQQDIIKKLIKESMDGDKKALDNL
jgi:hypothetical protein